MRFQPGEGPSRGLLRDCTTGCGTDGSFYSTSSNGTRSGEDTELDCDNLYFTDPDMLARVPRMFLLSGGLYALFGVISLFLISEPSNTATAAELKSIVAQSEKKQYNTIQKDDNNNSEQQQSKSLTPKEVLKTPLFYQVKTTFYFC